MKFEELIMIEEIAVNTRKMLMDITNAPHRKDYPVRLLSKVLLDRFLKHYFLYNLNSECWLLDPTQRVFTNRSHLIVQCSVDIISIDVVNGIFKFQRG